MSEASSGQIEMQKLLTIDDAARIRKLGAGLVPSVAHALAQWVVLLLSEGSEKVEVSIAHHHCEIRSQTGTPPRVIVQALAVLRDSTPGVEAHERALIALDTKGCAGLISFLGLAPTEVFAGFGGADLQPWGADDPSAVPGGSIGFVLRFCSTQVHGKHTAEELLQVCSECAHALEVNHQRPRSKLADARFRQRIMLPDACDAAILEEADSAQIYLSYRGVILAHLTNPKAPWLSAVLEVPREMSGCSATDLRAYAADRFVTIQRAAHDLLLAALAQHRKLAPWLRPRLFRAAFSHELSPAQLDSSMQVAIFAARHRGKPSSPLSMRDLEARLEVRRNEHILEVLDEKPKRAETLQDFIRPVLSASERALVAETLHCRCLVASCDHGHRPSWRNRLQTHALRLHALVACALDRIRVASTRNVPSSEWTAAERLVATRIASNSKLEVRWASGDARPALWGQVLVLSRSHPPTRRVVDLAGAAESSHFDLALIRLLGVRSLRAGLLSFAKTG